MSGRSRVVRVILGLAGAVLTLTLAAVLVLNGVIQLNHPSPERYPVRGVDVSRYQGQIDWPVLAGQGIDFAFIKATEGSGLVDPCFAANLSGATETGLRVGAYHFFSFESAGATQADNVVRTVPAGPELLPVAVDLEFYGGFGRDPAPVEQVRRELRVLLDRLAAHYGRKPLIYTTADAYDRYLSGAFPHADIWIRDVWRAPSLPDGRAWTFWQFSDRYRLDGYAGEEPFIDVNVFAGSRAEWERCGR
ncbi:MAG: GH25 family lysozyme [Micropruina sp.]|uniref:GH25 family lysozyme n=1 Tax=Micropruina sp. TaxID=2737536 RepID=UPI0039E478AF